MSDRGDDEPIETSLSRDLQVRLEQSLRTTFLDDDPTFVDATIPPNTKSLDPADAFHLAPQSNTLLPLLIAWRDQGVLADRIKFISLASLEFWRDNLSSLRGSSAPPSTAAIDAVLEEFKDTVLRLSDDRDELLRCWLVLAVEIADRLGVLPGECAVQQALERIIGTTHRQSDSPIQVGQSSEAREPGTLVGESRPSLSRMSTTNHQPGQQSTPTSERKVLYEGEFAVGSVLPLLLLGPLARVGYWQTLCAVLETAELKSDRHLFAAALAFKVLDPIKPGLVRSAASMASAAVFAALSAAPSASDLAEFARRIAQYVSPLDALLADELLKGHDCAATVTFRTRGRKRGTIARRIRGCLSNCLVSHHRTVVAAVKPLPHETVIDSPDNGRTSTARSLRSRQCTIRDPTAPPAPTNLGVRCDTRYSVAGGRMTRILPSRNCSPQRHIWRARRKKPFGYGIFSWTFVPSLRYPTVVRSTSASPWRQRRGWE